jgi:hypothetical protein
VEVEGFRVHLATTREAAREPVEDETMLYQPPNNEQRAEG